MDHEDYPNIDVKDFFPCRDDDSQEKYIKQTLLHSPIFTNIIPGFKVNLSKPFRGIISSSFNDEADQYLGQQEEDSQRDIFSDDEDELLLDLAPVSKAPSMSPLSEMIRDEIVSIKIIIKLTSLVIDDVEYHLNAPVRSSCRVSSEEHDEDSLLLSLKSGFLLLIRIFYVPRDLTKRVAGIVLNDNLKEYVFEPYIVQWWDTSSRLSIPSLESSGHSLSCHSSGRYVISCSANGLFRIYPTQMTNNGMVFQPHINVPLNGFILHSCFAKPLKESIFELHYIFMTLVFTNHKRLEINLFDWFSDNVQHDMTKTTLPLDNSFHIPIFVIPVKSLNGFLFIYEHEFIIISIHNIVSAEYEFRYVPFSGAFPTTYYVPETSILKSNESDEEVVIATDNGTIYSLIVKDTNDVSIVPIIRIADSISVFSLEKDKSGFLLNFGSDTGSNRVLNINGLFCEDDLRDSEGSKQKLGYSSVLLIHDYRNWSPVIDIQIIDTYKQRTLSNHSDQELWTLTGTGKRTRLTHLRNGYFASRKSRTFESLRRALKTQVIEYNNKTYLFATLPLLTVVLEYQHDEVEEFAEIEDPLIISNAPTILISKLPTPEEIFIQVVDSALFLTNLSNALIALEFHDKRVLDCDADNELLLIVSETLAVHSHRIIELYKLDAKIDWNKSFKECNALTMVQTEIIDYQPSVVRFFQIKNERYFTVGSFDGWLYVYAVGANFFRLIHELSLYHLLNEKGFDSQSLVANDIVYLENSLHVGTRDGFSIQLKWNPKNEIFCDKILQVGDTSVNYCVIPNYEKCMLIYSRTLWLLNLYDSAFPYRVFFDEKHDRAISTVAPLPNISKSKSNPSFAFVREEGLVTGSIFTHKKPCVKQINLSEPAKKFLYMPHIFMFLVLCPSKECNSRLKFVDRKLFKILPHEEYNSKAIFEHIFNKNEIPTALCIWLIRRSGRVSQKLLVGTSIDSSRGSIKILDVNRSHSSDNEVIKVTELTSFDHGDPVSCIQQVESNIVFSSGKSIYSTSYNMNERRMRPISNLITLSSDITSLIVEKPNKLLVTTKLDSIYQFLYMLTSTEENSESLKLIANDPLSKSLVNQANIKKKVVVGEKLNSSILIMNLNDWGFPSQFSYKMSAIPRVYASRFNSRWAIRGDSEETDEPSNILSVGVNGEVVSFRLISENSIELQSLMQTLNDGMKFKELLDVALNKYDDPFIDKVTGKGLIGLNKPYFDFKDNKEKKGVVIDYDIEEFSRASMSNICI